MHGHTRADRRSHRLINKVNFARASAFGRFTNCASLHLRGPIRNTDQYARTRPEIARFVCFSDEVLQHLLGDREIGDDAVFQWPNRSDVAWRTAQHVLGLGAHSLNGAATPARILTNRHNRRFIEHDASPT